jgi:hypothetical protein
MTVDNDPEKNINTDSHAEKSGTQDDSLVSSLGAVAGRETTDVTGADETTGENSHDVEMAEMIDRVEGVRDLMTRHLYMYEEARARDEKQVAMDTMLRTIDGLILEQHFDMALYDQLQSYRERYVKANGEVGEITQYHFYGENMHAYAADYVTPLRRLIEEKVLNAKNEGEKANPPAWAVRVYQLVGELSASLLQLGDRLSELDRKDKDAQDGGFTSMRSLLDSMTVSSFDSSEMNGLRSRVADLAAYIGYANSARERVGNSAADIRRDCDLILSILDNAKA